MMLEKLTDNMFYELVSLFNTSLVSSSVSASWKHGINFSAEGKQGSGIYLLIQSNYYAFIDRKAYGENSPTLTRSIQPKLDFAEVVAQRMSYQF